MIMAGANFLRCAEGLYLHGMLCSWTRFVFLERNGNAGQNFEYSVICKLLWIKASAK